VPRGAGVALLGRCFVHPIFDYLLIGGGLSLAVAAIAVFAPRYTAMVGFPALASMILLSNSAHFAASSVRLYTRRGAFEAWPFLTMSLPLVTLGALAVCLVAADVVGRHALGLTLTWSAYHYAAQAYGLAVMYAYRSGCQLGPADKRLLWAVSLVPFLFVVGSGVGLGLDWLVPAPMLTAEPVDGTLRVLSRLLPWVGFAGIALLFVRTWRCPSGPLPLISVLTLVTNAVWWFVLDPLGAFLWATIFHGLQYLAIAAVFHVKERVGDGADWRGALYHASWFYGASLLLGYALFYCLPWAFSFAGFGLLQSLALVVVAVNLHHFVVDAFIWRLRPGDANRRIAEAGLAASA
jgi:hypothetical protein